MNSIYLLKRRTIDRTFGEHSDWKIVGWTDRFEAAVAWKHRTPKFAAEHRTIEEVKPAGLAVDE